MSRLSQRATRIVRVRAIEHRVARLVDHAHRPLTELGQKLVAAELLLGNLLGAHGAHHCLGMLAFTLLNTGPQIG